MERAGAEALQIARISAQRAGIILIGIGFLLNMRFGIRSAHYAIGLLGAVVAYFTVEFFDWRYAYFIGGGLGLLLLLLRVSVAESGIYNEIKHAEEIQKGNFFSFFTNKDRFIKELNFINRHNSS